MQKYSDKTSAAERINILGSRKIPFFFLINFNMDKTVIFENPLSSHNEILFDFNGIKNHKNSQAPRVDITLKSFPEPFESYLQKFSNVMRHISAGDTYLLNLTARTDIEINAGLSDIFYNIRAKYKILFNNFICFSPETFITIKNHIITSRPMKGTIDSSVKNAESVILNDKKETAEHYTITDLIRNDLSKIADNVRVEKFRYIDRIKTGKGDLMQVCSKITGILPGGFESRLGDMLFSLLPAGSVSGAPKKRTVEIILETENYDRGFYTGICGYFDGENLDSAVLIRFIEKTDSGFVYKSGGGVTFFSDAASEYRELIRKIYAPVS
jgi:para-aminobenzoate synthetase component 1